MRRMRGDGRGNDGEVGRGGEEMRERKRKKKEEEQGRSGRK